MFNKILQKAIKVVSAANKANQILEDLNNKNKVLYWHFLRKALPIFEKANEFLQKEEPDIHKLHKVLTDQFCNLVIRFVKPKCIAKCESVHDIDFSRRKNQKDDDDLFIGDAAKEYLLKHGEHCDKATFFASVRAYYVAACEYMLKMFPFGEDLLVNAEFLDVNKRLLVKYSQIEYYCERYNIFTSENKEHLQEEFLKYQVEKLPTNILNAERVDTCWHLISQITDTSTCVKKYNHLCEVAKCVLAIYNSNTDCERLFSLVNKNKTEFRSSMGTLTLSSLLTRKMMCHALETPCYSTQHSNELLKKCKSATTLGLKS